MPRGLDTYTHDIGPLIALLAEPTVGKTSVIGALLDHIEPTTGLPYELNVVDLDRQLLPLFNKWGKSDRRPKEVLDRVWAVQTSDELRLGATGLPEPAVRALEWERVRSLAERFGDLGPGSVKHEPYVKWAMNQVLVFDSVSAMIGAAFRHVMPGRESGFFTKETDVGGKRLVHKDPGDYGKAADAVGGLIDVIGKRPIRRFPIIMTFHVDHISISLAKMTTDDELQDALENKTARDELATRFKKETSIQVQSERMYPIVATAKQGRQILRHFNYVLPVIRDARNAPAVSTVSTSAVDARVPGQVGGLPKTLSGDVALHTIIQHHLSLSPSKEA